MFQLMDRQISMAESCFWMPGSSRQRLEETWPNIFRTKVLRMIPESDFASLYSADQGRPNVPVAILISLSILKEMLDLTDEALMDAFRFDMRFHYALGLCLDDTELSVRTLYYFRSRVAGSPLVGTTFDRVTDQIIETLGLNAGKQRMDSTHIRSNMATLTRLGLFTRTMEQFLARLENSFPDRREALPKVLKERYGERPGHFADVRSSQGRRRLETAAKDIWTLVDRFRGDADVCRMHAYKLMKRLLDEQCDISSDGGDAEPVALKPGKEVASDSLQNPSDPDATYDGHKGQGYQVQISETCDKDNPIQVITRVEVEQAHKSDHNALIPTIDALVLRGHTPETLYADTSYNSGENLLEATDRGVDLMAPTPGKADPDGIDLRHFDIDLENMEVCACFEGEKPIRNRLGADGETRNLLFDPERCRTCELADDCVVGRQKGRLRYHPKDLAIAFSRAREESETFKEAYKTRAGIESVNAECKTAHGLGKVWSRGLPRVTFAATMKLLACNVKRFMRHSCALILESERKEATIPA